MGETAQDEALDLLARDARLGKAGAANAYARELRRRGAEGKITTQRQQAAERKRRRSTSHHLLDAWERHQASTDTACQCTECCQHAASILESLND